MRNEAPKNIGTLLGAEGYRTKTKIVQAPGGHTSLSLGWDNSNPFEHKTSHIPKNKPKLDNHASQYSLQPLNEGSGTSKAGYQSSFTNEPFFQMPNLKNNSTLPRGGQNSYQLPPPKFDVNEKLHRKNYEDLSLKSWNYETSYMMKNPPSSLKSPMEIGYLRYKNGDAAYPKPFEAFRHYDYEPLSTNFHSSQYNGREGSPIKMREMAQTSSLQNNYKNILNDFSNLKSQIQSPSNTFVNQFRASAGEFQDNKDLAWSGKKIVHPPGGGSNFKLWG